MLDIKKMIDGRCMTVALSGQLDSATSLEFDSAMQNLENVDEVTLDLKGLDYISSGGLRVVMGFKRRLGARPLRFENIGLEVREVFDITGSSVLLGL